MKKVVIPSLYLFLFLITFIVNACTKLASDFDSNSSVEEIIKNANEAFEKRSKKLLIITGKGLRSKVYNNPYQSQEMNVLKNSVPEFIMNDEDLFNKITKISKASIQDGGDGAFYIFLK